MDVLDEILGAGLLVRGSGGFFGVGGVNSSFVVEAVEVAASVLELLDPFLGLLALVSILFLKEVLVSGLRVTDLSDHHVAVEGAFTK